MLTEKMLIARDVDKTSNVLMLSIADFSTRYYCSMVFFRTFRASFYGTETFGNIFEQRIKKHIFTIPNFTEIFFGLKMFEYLFFGLIRVFTILFQKCFPLCMNPTNGLLESIDFDKQKLELLSSLISLCNDFC